MSSSAKGPEAFSSRLRRSSADLSDFLRRIREGFRGLLRHGGRLAQALLGFLQALDVFAKPRVRLLDLLERHPPRGLARDLLDDLDSLSCLVVLRDDDRDGVRNLIGRARDGVRGSGGGGAYGLESRHEDADRVSDDRHLGGDLAAGSADGLDRRGKARADLLLRFVVEDGEALANVVRVEALPGFLQGLGILAGVLRKLAEKALHFVDRFLSPGADVRESVAHLVGRGLDVSRRFLRVIAELGDVRRGVLEVRGGFLRLPAPLLPDLDQGLDFLAQAVPGVLEIGQGVPLDVLSKLRGHGLDGFELTLQVPGQAVEAELVEDARDDLSDVGEPFGQGRKADPDGAGDGGESGLDARDEGAEREQHGPQALPQEGKLFIEAARGLGGVLQEIPQGRGESVSDGEDGPLPGRLEFLDGAGQVLVHDLGHALHGAARVVDLFRELLELGRLTRQRKDRRSAAAAEDREGVAGVEAGGGERVDDLRQGAALRVHLIHRKAQFLEGTAGLLRRAHQRGEDDLQSVSGGLALDAGVAQDADRRRGVFDGDPERGRDRADLLHGLAHLQDVGVRARRRLGDGVAHPGQLGSVLAERREDVRRDVGGVREIERPGLGQAKGRGDGRNHFVDAEAGPGQEFHAFRGLGGGEPGGRAHLPRGRGQRLHLLVVGAGHRGNGAHLVAEVRDGPDRLGERLAHPLDQLGAEISGETREGPPKGLDTAARADEPDQGGVRLAQVAAELLDLPAEPVRGASGLAGLLFGLLEAGLVGAKDPDGLVEGLVGAAELGVERPASPRSLVEAVRGVLGGGIEIP